MLGIKEREKKAGKEREKKAAKGIEKGAAKGREKKAAMGREKKGVKRQRADVRHNLNEIQLVQQFILLSIGGR